MAEGSDRQDVLRSGPGRQRRWTALVPLVALLAVLALLHSRSGGTASHPRRPTTGSPTARPLTAVAVRSDRDGVSRAGRARASFRVLVSNPNDQPVYLLRVGQAVSGMSLYNVVPTPQRIPPHGSGAVTVTYQRDPGLPCGPVGTPLLVAVSTSSSTDATVLRWTLPLRIHGQPWDAALGAVLCAR